MSGGSAVKAYLSQAKQADRRIMALAERRRRCLELGGYRSLGRATALDELQGELDRQIEDYARLVRDIERRIDAVDNPQYRDVLRYRYLNGWSWQRIAGQMCFSRDWLLHLHARALEAMEGEGEGKGNRE